MATTGERLRQTIGRASQRLTAVTDAIASQSRGPGKWTRKQILGHLIDSALNNHQRFVRAQLGDDLVFPTYDQERWVVLGQYANAPWVSLLTLWRELNQQIVRVMDGAPPEVLDALRVRHNFHQIAFNSVPENQPATLRYLMDDYVDHLEHHLKQFEPLPDSQPLRR